MKTFMKTCAAALLALTLAVASALGAAMGEELTDYSVQIHEDTELHSGVFWSSAESALRTENYVTYTPGGPVKPVVTFGGALTERVTVAKAASQRESAGYRVVAGINGDHFNTSNGLPIGLVISDGTLRSTDAGYYALGFRAAGSAVIGRPPLRVQADLGYGAQDGGTYTQYVRNITAVNKVREDNGIYLYTRDFNSRHTTGTTAEGVSLICRITGGSLSVGGTLTAEAVSVTEGTASPEVEEGCIVLTATSASNNYFTDVLRNVPVGVEVTVTVTSEDGRWNEVTQGMGALYPLLKDGAVVTSSASSREPRTAVGVKEDGSVVLYTVDGRKSHSSGASMEDVAKRLAELGCADAVCLDGGGSTTLAVTKPDSVKASVANIPSEGTARAVSDQIFLVASNRASGELARFYVEPAYRWVLAGTSVPVSVSGVDTNHIPMDAKYALTATAGELKDDVLLTPAEGGDITISVIGGQPGSAVVHAVAEPDTLAVTAGGKTVKSLTVKPGSRTALGVAAEYGHLALTVGEEVLRWEFNGSCAALADGQLAALAPGEGTLSVTAGTKRVEIPVTVSASALSTVEDFEGDASLTEGDGIVDMEAERVSDPAVVGRGRWSGAFRYTLDADHDNTAQWRWSEGRKVDTGLYSALDLWVRGDGSGNTLEILCAGGSVLPALTLDFTGWRQITLALPSGPCTIQGVRVSAPVEEGENGAPVFADTPRHGTVYLDQLTASFPGSRDVKVPSVTLTASETGTHLSGAVRDETDGILPRSAISVTRDGRPEDFVYNASSGTLRLEVRPDGGPHRYTLTAKDASGNIGRASWDLTGTEGERRFTDTADYWAADYVDFLYDAGITTGYTDGTFRPDQSITRAQFAAMLFRYLGLDAEKWQDKELPFADADGIPAYARAAAAALYEMGVVTGSAGKDGKLYFDPSGLLTRAQAAAMIGRTQAKGYAETTPVFSDASSIPNYALPYIRTMAAQGVISGYSDGTFRPARSITRGQMAKILYNLM